MMGIDTKIFLKKGQITFKAMTMTMTMTMTTEKYNSIIKIPKNL
jgi:hypothetical protein